MRKRLKVAVVGASMSKDVGRHQRFAITGHLPALKALPDLYEVIATCTTTMETAKAAASHFAVPYAFDSVARMLEAVPDIDIVCASVRPVAQFDVVMAALAAGKHVYCEHSFGANSAQAAQMSELARRNNLRTVVGHEHHYEPSMLEFSRLMREGYIGDPINFGMTFFNSGLVKPQASPRGWLAQSEMGGPPAWRTGHSLERLTSVFGSIDEVCADMMVHSPKQPQGAGSQITQINNINALIRTKSGVMGSMQVSLTAWFGTAWNFQVYGTRGMLMLREEDLGKRSTLKDDEKSGVPKLYAGLAGDPAVAVVQPERHYMTSGLDHLSAPVAEMWAAFSEAIQSGSDCQPSFHDELKIHYVWDAIEQSMKTRRWEKVPAN